MTRPTLTTGFEIDPCGTVTQTPGKFTAGPISVDLEGNVERAIELEELSEKAAGASKLGLEGKLTAKYCATTLD